MVLLRPPHTTGPTPLDMSTSAVIVMASHVKKHRKASTVPARCPGR